MPLTTGLLAQEMRQAPRGTIIWTVLLPHHMHSGIDSRCFLEHPVVADIDQ